MSTSHQAAQALLVDPLVEFLRGVQPPLEGRVFECFAEHDVRLEDLRDPGFDSAALQRMGVYKVGVQLRILRHIKAEFSSHQSVSYSDGYASGGAATAHRLRGAFFDNGAASAVRVRGPSSMEGKTPLSPTMVSSRAYQASKLPPPPPGVRAAAVLITDELSGRKTEQEKWEAQRGGEGENWGEEGWRRRGGGEWHAISDETPSEPPPFTPSPAPSPAPPHQLLSYTKRKNRNKNRPPKRGIVLEALESMDSKLVPHLLCVLTPSSRPLWAKYAGELGREILRRVEEALASAPVDIPDFEVPVIINMLLWESTRTSFVSLFRGSGNNNNHDNDFDDDGGPNRPSSEQLDARFSQETLIRCVLPQPGDFTFEWFRAAPDDAVEALVLPFDKKLVAAYEERPADLVTCLVDAVHARVQEHVSIF